MHYFGQHYRDLRSLEYQKPQNHDVYFEHAQTQNDLKIFPKARGILLNQ